MTISPQPPNLVPVDEKDTTRRLVEPHLTFVKVGFGYSLMILIKPGFETDGASVPEKIFSDEEYKADMIETVEVEYEDVATRWDLENLIKYLIGNRWDMPRLLAAIAHDCLYGRKWMWRWVCDRIYRMILGDNNYDRRRIEIEYAAIRLAGWRNWNSVTNEEQKKVEAHSEVEFIRTKNIEKEIEKLKGSTSVWG